MASPIRPRAEDDIRDSAAANLDAGQAQVEAQQDPEADTTLETRAAQYTLNHQKRQDYEAKVRAAEARRANQPSAQAWQNVASAGGGKEATAKASAKASEALRDETLLAGASTRIAQDKITHQRENEQFAAAEKREQDKQAATELREFEARGGETLVDPTTGEKTRATHPDGNLRYKPGAVDGTKPTTVQSIDSINASIPMIGAMANPNNNGPVTQTREVVQPTMNDRGGIANVPLEQKTDPATGEIYSETKDEFGQTQRVTLGTDPKIPRLNQIQTEIDTRAMELQSLDVQRMQIEPRYKQAEAKYEELRKKHDEAPPFIQIAGKWVENQPGIPTDPSKQAAWAKNQFPDQEKLADFQRSRQTDEPAWRTATKRYEAEKPAWENLQKQQQEIKLRHEQAILAKKRVELDLPEEDGGVAEILTAAEAGTPAPDPAGVVEHFRALATAPGIGDMVATASGIAPVLPPLPESATLSDQPLIPQDDPGKLAAFADAFGGLVAPEALTIGASGKGYSFIKRDGGNIGSFEVDRETGRPRVVIDARFAPADILQQVTLGRTTGTDVYLRDSGRINPRKEADWSASIHQAIGSNKDPQAMGEIIISMGASPEMIVAKVKGGELSVQRGEAMMKELWGSSFKAEDPTAKGAFDKWIYEQAPTATRHAWAESMSTRSTATKNEVMQTYLDEWQARNAWKPGVTLQQRVDFEKQLKLTPRTSEQIADLADSFVITAIQSVAMLSQLAAPVTLPAYYVANPTDAGKWVEAVGRATANDTRMLGRTATRYATAEGQQAFDERNAISQLIRTTVMTQDIHTGGRESPEWKSAMDAAIRQATDNADKIHGWNREDGWEITREELDPATNAHLKSLIETYAITGNKDYLNAFMAAQLEDRGTQQTAKYQLDLAAGRNKYVAAWIQGTHASLYEAATEAASTALTLGAGKVLFGAGKALTASKAAAHMVKLEQAAAAGSRLAKFRLAMHGIKAEALKAGMVPDTLANPATRLGKLGNTASKVGKFVAGTGTIGALEEGFMGLARPDASVPNILHDAMIGAVMEPLLGGMMSVPTIGIGSAIQQSKVSRNVAKFSDAYNREFNGTEGFVPVTPQQAQAAMALFDGVNLNAFAQRLTESAANVKITVEAAAADTAGPAEIQAMHAAQAAHRETIDSVSESVFSRLEAVQHVESVQKEDRPLAHAIAKVAAGRADLVTPQERQAAAGAITPQGSPVFATAANGIDILTDEGRAHAMAKFPGVGMLIQTADSERMFQEQMAAEPAAATGQADPNAAPTAAPDNVADTANIPRVAVTPEQQQQAAQVTEQVISQITAEAPAIAARLSRGAATVRVSGGVAASVGADGMPRIQIIEDDIAQSLAAGMTPDQVATRVKDNIVLHETIHTLQFQVAEQQQTAAGVTGDPATLSQDFYRGIHSTMAAESPRMLENGRALYAENDDGSAPAWDTLPEWAQAAEVVRMLTEAQLAGRTTDISRLMDGASPSLLQKLAQIVKDMVAAITTGENIPESVKQHVDTLTDLYNQLLNATPSPTNASSPNPAADPSQPTPGQAPPGAGAAPQANSNRPASDNGGTQPPPGDNAGAPAQPAEQQARVTATGIVRKEFDKAIESRPLLKKDADLMNGLREAAIDISTAYSGRPDAEIKDAAARAIGAYLQSPEVSEKLGALYAAQSDKAKAYRAAATARVNAEADRVIAQRMATVRDLVESIGRITRPTNALELYRTGQTLPPEWNGMLRASDYAGAGKNAVARAILQKIYAPDSDSGISPDQAANGLSREFPDKYDQFTPDMLWTALAEELRSYVNGADTSNLLDPDADTSGMSDEDIQALADRHAKADIVEKWRGKPGTPQAVLPATAEAYEAEFLKLAAAQDFEADEAGVLVDPFGDEMQPEDQSALEAQAIATVNESVEAEAEARRPKTAAQTATLNPRVQELTKPMEGGLVATEAVLDPAPLTAVQNHLPGLTRVRKTPLVQRALALAERIIPYFQGNKKKMTGPVVSAQEQYSTPEQRAKVTTIHDLFGGGGAWGMVLAELFPNLQKIHINEFDPTRAIKIRAQIEYGDQFAEIADTPAVREALRALVASHRQRPAVQRKIATQRAKDAQGDFIGQDNYTDEQIEEMNEAWSWGVINKTAAAMAKQLHPEQQEQIIAVFKTMADDPERSGPWYQANPDAEPTVDELVQWFQSRHAPKAAAIKAHADALGKRGVKFEFTTGDAYTLDIETGDHVAAVADPPYFATTGYDEVNQKTVVGTDYYQRSTKLMEDLVANDNHVIYTDEAWWLRKEIDNAIRPADLVAGQKLAQQISNTLDFTVVAEQIDSRYETLGLHNPAGSPMAASRSASRSRNLRGDPPRQGDGTGDQRGGGAPSGQVPAGTDGQAGLQPPGDEASLGSAPAQPSIAERMESDFGPLTPDNAFGSWGASTTEPGILYGYRGENGDGQADNGFGASEGVGLYLAKTRQDTEFFGKARQVNFPKPKRPLIVDQDATGEAIPLLQEDNEAIWDHIWSHQPAQNDSDWIKAHVLAAKQLGMTQENSQGLDTKLPRALTDILLSMGYDAVYVRSGGMQWVNLLAKPGQRFNRGTRSAGGAALYSAPAQPDIRSPQFKQFFGDWENSPESASKVVDPQGNPMLVSHGTKWDFPAISINPRKGAAFFSSSEAMAKMMAEGPPKMHDVPREFKSTTAKPRVIRAYLNLRNPFDHTKPEHIARLRQHGPRLAEITFSLVERGSWLGLEKPGTVAAMQRAGFDGFLVREADKKMGQHQNYAVFSTDQIMEVESSLFSAPAQNPSAQYRYLKAKQDKAGLTPAEQQALLRAEAAMGQSFAIDMDDPALKARKGSVSPSFQPTLNLEHVHPITGQQLALFSAPAQDAEYLAAVESGDMETAQRMVDEAAKAAGAFEVWRGHESTNRFDTRRASPTFTTEQRVAEIYAADYEAGQVLKSFAFLSNPLRFDDPTGAITKSQFEGMAKSLGMSAAQIELIGNSGDWMDDGTPFTWDDAAPGAYVDFFYLADNSDFSKAAKDSGYDGFLYHGMFVTESLPSFERTSQMPLEIRPFSPEQIKSADPVTRDSQGDVIPLSQRFNPDSDSVLYSAPAQPNAEAVLDAAFKGMSPIYLKVLQASMRPATPTPADLAAEFRLPERAIVNIIGTARVRIQAHGRTVRPGGLAPARTAEGKLKGGMPQRANSTTSILAAVDQLQQQEGLPLGKTANEIHTKGYAILQRPDATQHLLDAHQNGIPDEGQIFAAAQLLLEAGIKGEQSAALTELALLYRQRGTEQSDAFRARIDIHRTPAERNALIFQELFTSPNKQVQKAWREAKTPEQKSAILQEWNARVKGVKEALKTRGLDLQDAMDRLAAQRTDAKAAESEASQAHQKLVDALQADVARLQAQLAAATDEAAKQAAQTQVDAAQEKADQAAALDPANTIRLELQKLSKPERAAIEDLRDGGTWESAASNSFLSVIDVKRVFDKFAAALDDAGARAILLAEDILLDKQARLNSPAANAMSREDRARQGAAAIRKALGYDRNLIDRRSKGIEAKPKKGGSKKSAADRPEPAAMSDAQFQAYLDNPQSWRPLWQAEAALTQETMSFDEWMRKPETRAKQARQQRMFRQPVSTFTGELDMHDPISVKRAFDEFNIHNASLFDKALAIWRMGILSGLHTGIVNFGGNVAHSQYNLWPRRLLEAGVNNALSALGLGSKEAATFGELKYMAQAQHKAMSRAGTAMALSWKMDTRIVESEVLALGTQLEFSGIGADYIPKSVGGPLGKLLHAISFRHMTAADEMIKAYHAQTEVMAQAYRIAKAEGLAGAAFDQRMDELLEYGSQAWRKAMDAATWVTFQNEVDPKNPRSLAIFDRAASGLRRLAHTDTGKTKEIINGKGQKVTVPVMKPNVFAFFFPFINTPLNIMKIGIEMSPVGAFFSTVDALRALKIRIENKSISPEQSRIEASELYNRMRLIQDVTNQIIGMGMFYAIGSLVKPDDDEELPWITGSTDWKSTSKGDRDLRSRVMPAYTIRVPFTDAMLTYQRIEPFGTALGFIIDARIAVNKKGWSDEALGEFMATAINQFNDKTYMKGLSDLMTLWNDPERIGTRLTSSIVTGFVPNLIRQPIREADPYMRDTKPGTDVGFVEGVWHNIKYSLAPGYAPIAMDVWGNPVKRHPGMQVGNVHTDVLLRVFNPTNLTIRDQIDPLDLYLFNWNNTAATPKERFNIEPIQKNLQLTRSGKTTTVQLSTEDHQQANRNAGQAARAMLGDDWDASNPQPQQVERVKEVLQKFQKRERDRLRNKYASTLPAE